jgi:hypothetical protein
MQTPDRRRVVVYLAALVGREPAGLLEMRWRHDDGMRRRFYRAADELPAAAAAIIEHGVRTDVYVGCASRSRRAGGLDAIARAWVLWVDCDSPQAVAALARFTPPPSIVVRSGNIRSGQLQRGCGRSDRCWRHVASGSEVDVAGGWR